MNRQIVLAAVPEGMVTEDSFRMQEAGLPKLPDKGVLIRTKYLSVDPYLRGRMTGKATYIPPILVGAPMQSGAVGEVLESNTDTFKPGDIVTGMWDWQEVIPHSGEGLRKLDAAFAPPSTALGVLGLTGLTAYFGLLEICAPKPGDTVFISGAAGATGSTAGQIAKIAGCRVIGSAGGSDKVEWLREIGFDATLDYRSDRPYDEALTRLCPEGIDCYFDNVGGELTDTVFGHLRTFARVAVCGQISQYNNRAGDIGVRPFWPMIMKQVRCEGFLVSRWTPRFQEALQKLGTWLREGKLKYRETVYEGIESTPAAFVGLFTGSNTGKAVVRL